IGFMLPRLTTKGMSTAFRPAAIVFAKTEGASGRRTPSPMLSRPFQEQLCQGSLRVGLLKGHIYAPPDAGSSWGMKRVALRARGPQHPTKRERYCTMAPA